MLGWPVQDGVYSSKQSGPGLIVEDDDDWGGRKCLWWDQHILLIFTPLKAMKSNFEEILYFTMTHACQVNFCWVKQDTPRCTHQIRAPKWTFTLARLYCEHQPSWMIDGHLVHLFPQLLFSRFHLFQKDTIPHLTSSQPASHKLLGSSKVR